MTARLRPVLRRARTRERTVGDHLYSGYLGVLVILVVAAPAVRAVWIVLVDPAVLPMLAAVPMSVVPALALLAVGAALIIGATAGPAARTPLMTALLADSPFSRPRAFGGPVVRVCAFAGAIVGSVAAAWAWPLVSAGALELAPAIGWSVVGILFGVVSGVGSLAGQRFVRAAPLIGAAIVVAAIGIGFVPAPPLMAGTNNLWASAVAVAVVLAAAALSSIPALLNSLHSAALVSTAQRRESAIDGAVLLDTAAVADATRGIPYAGRRRLAVSARQARNALSLQFLRRDVVGWTRTPGRLVVAVVGLGCAAVLGMFALPVPGLGWLAVPAAVIVYAAAGPFTDGARLAAEASDAPALYGLSPLALLALHLVAPAAVLVVAIVVTGVLVLAGIVAVGAVVCVPLVGAAALTARIADARKPPLPVAMLAPIVTPFGDMAAANRVIWTLGPVLATAAVGLSATVPPLSAAILAGLLLHAASRWRTARLHGRV
ncbi:hypothetical protein [Microbacterium gorillae]|uniref:hypothetical protein n=1 Tax=Microbacterium gorillae TaxID=1231063 RepID=UPI003D98B629